MAAHPRGAVGHFQAGDDPSVEIRGQGKYVPAPMPMAARGTGRQQSYSADHVDIVEDRLYGLLDDDACTYHPRTDIPSGEGFSFSAHIYPSIDIEDLCVIPPNCGITMSEKCCDNDGRVAGHVQWSTSCR